MTIPVASLRPPSPVRRYASPRPRASLRSEVSGFCRNRVRVPGTMSELAGIRIAVMIAGFAFCWWARIHLGRLWSMRVTKKEGHHVVDTGPYGVVRHPIYTGILVAHGGRSRNAACAGGGA